MRMMPSKVSPFSSAQAHYDQPLAEHYDWMFGMPHDSWWQNSRRC
jgi:hypothetical protein